MPIFTTVTLEDLPPSPPNKTGWPWLDQTEPLLKYMPDGSDWPRITIVTPSYNQGQFLEATIRSVLLQGYPNLEYIIIDGNSTDGSIEIIKKYEAFLTHWSSETDFGQAHAVNKGIQKSAGEIIGWINSDDIYAKGSFLKVVQAFQRNSDCILVHGNRILINENDEVTGWSQLPPFDPQTCIYNVCSETAFWRRNATVEIELLNESLQFAIDLDFFGRLYKKGSFLKLSEYLGYFRCHSQSKSSTISHIGREEAQREWKRLFGSKNLNWQLHPKQNSIEKIFTLFRYPMLIGIPYLKYKLR